MLRLLLLLTSLPPSFLLLVSLPPMLLALLLPLHMMLPSTSSTLM